MNRLNSAYRLAIVYNDELNGMDGSIGSIPEEGDHNLRRRSMAKERNIKRLYPSHPMPATLLGFIFGVL